MRASLYRVLTTTILCTSTMIFAQVAPPAYTVNANVLRPKSGSGYEVTVGKNFKYLGVSRFHIRTAADAELHLFAKADANGHLQRLVWVQIESQLPGQDWQYDYPSPDRTNLGELEFITDSKAFREYVADDPTSDHAVVDRILHENKLSFADPVMRLRMIYLPDTDRRRELMVIYASAMPEKEISRIGENGTDASAWPDLLQSLKKEAQQAVKTAMK